MLTSKTTIQNVNLVDMGHAKNPDFCSITIVSRPHLVGMVTNSEDRGQISYNQLIIVFVNILKFTLYLIYTTPAMASEGKVNF